METLSEKERNPEPEKDRLKRTKTCNVFDRDALMDKEQRLAERAQELPREQEEAIAETASKLADKT